MVLTSQLCWDILYQDYINRLEIRKNAGNQWDVTKNQLQIGLEKYMYSERHERRDLHLSEHIYFPRPICNMFLVTLH